MDILSSFRQGINATFPETRWKRLLQSLVEELFRSFFCAHAPFVVKGNH